MSFSHQLVNDFIHEENIEGLRLAHASNYHFTEGHASLACFGGKINSLKFLVNVRCPMAESCSWTAAGYGHLECLKLASEMVHLSTIV